MTTRGEINGSGIDRTHVSRTRPILCTSLHGENDSTRPLPVSDVHANARPFLRLPKCDQRAGAYNTACDSIIAPVCGASFGFVLDVLCRVNASTCVRRPSRSSDLAALGIFCGEYAYELGSNSVTSVSRPQAE